MIVFSTEFPAGKNASAEKLLGVAVKWLTGGPNYPWKLGELKVPSPGELKRVELHGQVVDWGIVEGSTGQIAAFRHTWNEKHTFEWCTEVVGTTIGGGFWVSVRLSCHSLQTGRQLPPVNNPYITRLLLDDLGYGDDGGFTITGKPKILLATQVPLAAAIIRGELPNRLPVIYVSAVNKNEYFVDPTSLARMSSGLAHVVVEPSRDFAQTLRQEVDGRNAYAGAIGVYWPRGSSRHLRFVLSDRCDADGIKQILAEIRAVMCTMRPTSGLSWSAAVDADSRMRVDLVRTGAGSELSNFIKVFDSELEAKSKLLQEANSEIARLQSELRSMQSGSSTGAGILQLGNEKDLFGGEIREIVVEVLKRSLTSIGDGTRPCHVIKDIIDSNPVADRRSAYKEAVKRLLATTGTVSGRAAAELEPMGFSITAEGKHLKAVFGGDGRYTFAISKTPGDHRAGKNLVSEINKQLFS